MDEYLEFLQIKRSEIRDELKCTLKQNKKDMVMNTPEECLLKGKYELILELENEFIDYLEEKEFFKDKHTLIG